MDAEQFRAVAMRMAAESAMIQIARGPLGVFSALTFYKTFVEMRGLFGEFEEFQAESSQAMEEIMAKDK